MRYELLKTFAQCGSIGAHVFYKSAGRSDSEYPSKLYPTITTEEAKRYGQSLRKQQDSGWNRFVPSVPQASTAIGLVGSVGDEIGKTTMDMADDIAYQFQPVTLDDEARRWHGNSDPYYHNILVAGANAGGKGIFGVSDMPFGIMSKGPNRELFRNGQIDDIKKAIEDAVAKGLHPRVVGHSWGAADVAGLAGQYPGIPFIAADPVSWTGRLDEIPENLTILRPEKSDLSNNTIFSYLAGVLGGRWPEIRKGKGKTVYYDGGHVSGIGRALNNIMYQEWARRGRNASNR